MKGIIGDDRLMPVHSQRLFNGHMEDVLLAAAQRNGDFCLLIYGSPDASVLRFCCETFTSVAVHGELSGPIPENCLQMQDFSDRMHFDLGVNVALLLCPPSSSDAASLDQLLSPEAVVMTAGHYQRFEMDVPARTVLRLDANQAYRGQIDRWVAISNQMKSARCAAVVGQ